MRFGADPVRPWAYGLMILPVQSAYASGSYRCLLCGPADQHEPDCLARIGMTAELLSQLFGATNRFRPGQREAYIAYWRTGSAVVAANAFRYLQVK